VDFVDKNYKMVEDALKLLLSKIDIPFESHVVEDAFLSLIAIRARNDYLLKRLYDRNKYMALYE